MAAVQAVLRAISESTATDHALKKIVALLVWMAEDCKSDFKTDEIHSAAHAVLIKYASTATGGTRGSTNTAYWCALDEIIDKMMLHKDETLKDPNETLAFMRRAAKIRKELRDTSSDNATERVELDKDEVSLCYLRFGRILLTDDLLSHQKKDKRYCLRNKFDGDTHLTEFQRSVYDSLLRKFLGDKRVAFLIWQHGIPSIADNYRRVDSKVLDMGILQRGLAECLHASSGILVLQITSWSTRPKKVSTPSCRRAPWTNRSSNGSRRAGKRYRKRGMPCGSV